MHLLQRASLEHHPAVQAGRDMEMPMSLSLAKRQVGLFTCSTIWYKYPFCGSRSHLQAQGWLHPSLGLLYLLLNLYTAGDQTVCIPLPVNCYHKTTFIFLPLFAGGMFWFLSNSEYLTYFYPDDRKELAITVRSKSKSAPGAFGPH